MSLTYQSLLSAVPLVIRAGNVPNIVGEAGIGKSALVNDVTTIMGAQLFTTVVSLSEKGDLAIPVPPLTKESFVQTKNYGSLADVQFGYSHILVSIIEYAEKNPDQPIIWFLDEFNRGTQAVQSELMNLVLQREINSLVLPDQVHIVIAENPDSTMAGFEDTSYGVTVGDDAIKDRTVRLVMRVDVSDWLTWARQEENGRPQIHPLVQQYIESEPAMLHPQTRENDLYPTPRAWKRVSDNLFELDKVTSDVRQTVQLDLLQGDLGENIGIAFDQFIKEQTNLLTTKNVFADLNESKDQQIIDDVKQLNEVSKLQLLQNCVEQSDQYSFAKPGVARRFMKLLKLLSLDGQYAVVQSVGTVAHQKDILEPMYSAIEKDSETSVEQLYRYFGEVATRSEFEMSDQNE
ncbi:ATP-binding protein [Paucilactobacillus kaifaensis]|uniref:ATP-binding protein n=1 Tax=Paucilactobacillus kaifaensis TaxID=2559921 RepID=UPI0010F4B2BB|nr:ATP-binding protein [Paucilactobacillus kaifaensis]